MKMHLLCGERKMKKKNARRAAVCALILMAVMLLSVFPALAAESADPSQQTSFKLEKGKSYAGSLVLKRYTDFKNSGSISGNVIIMSRSFDSRGEIGGNVLAFASNMNLSGKVGKNLIGYYPNINLTGSSIKRDVFLYTDSFTSDENTVWGGDINMYTQDAVIKGKIAGDVAAVGNRVTINAVVDGNIEVACNELVLGNDAHVKGNVIYQCDSPLVKTDSTKIDGKVKQKNMGITVPQPEGAEGGESVISSFMTYFNTLSKICALILGLVFVKLLPISALKIELFTRKNYMKCFVAGALVSILVFPVSFILMLTVLGLPFALHLLSIYFDLVFIALIPAALVIGGLFTREKKLVNMMLMGTLFLLVIDYLPVIWIASTLSMLASMLGVGSIVLLVTLFLRYSINKQRTEYVTLSSINSSRDDLMKTKQAFDRLMNEKRARMDEERKANLKDEETEYMQDVSEEEEKTEPEFIDISQAVEDDPERYLAGGSKAEEEEDNEE